MQGGLSHHVTRERALALTLSAMQIFWTDRVVRFLASRYREDNGAGSIASEVEVSRA